MANKNKLIRLTTSDISLFALLKGQLNYLNQYYDVVGVSSNTGLLDKVAVREGIRTVEIPMHREISFKADILCLFRLIKLFKEESPFIVHANTPKGSLLAMIAAKICRVPHRIYTVTGLRFETAIGPFRFILKMMERIACLCSTLVIPEGDGVADTLRREHITNKPLKKILNGNINGIDSSFWDVDEIEESKDDIRKTLGFKPSDFVFIFVGRIVKDKGMDELAESMMYLKGRCKLLLVGPLENGDPISPRNAAFFENSKDVIMTGFQSDIRKFLKAADALVFPSYREGFPNVILQAGAMGLPVITSDVNGAVEVIENGKNGIVVPKRNTEALIEAMSVCIDSPEKVVEMSSVARGMVVSKFEQKEVWKALEEMYKSLK